jgi:NADH-quinone oxidoreductase subunit L
MLFTKHNRTLSWMLAWAAIISSLVMGWLLAFNVFGQGYHYLEEQPIVVASAIDWLPFGDYAQGLWVRIGMAVDPLTAVMLIMVPFATTMIFIYSVGYHNYGQPRGTHVGEPNHGNEDRSLRASSP